MIISTAVPRFYGQPIYSAAAAADDCQSTA